MLLAFLQKHLPMLSKRPLMLVSTLNGSLISVDRNTGSVLWTLQAGAIYVRINPLTTEDFEMAFLCALLFCKVLSNAHYQSFLAYLHNYICPCMYVCTYRSSAECGTWRNFRRVSILTHDCKCMYLHVCNI